MADVPPGGGVDASIITRAFPAPTPAPSAMESLGQTLKVGEGLVGLQSGLQTLRAKQALGPIMQGAIGPDGEIDYKKALTGVAGHPDTAWMAPEFANQALQREQTQAAIDVQKQEAAKSRLDVYGRQIGALAALGNGVTYKDIVRTAGVLAGAGFEPKALAAMMSKLPPEDPVPEGGKPNNVQLAKAVQQAHLGAMEAYQAAGLIYGTPTDKDVGGATLTTQVPTVGEQPSRVRMAIPKTLTPAEANALVEKKDDEGVPTLSPRAAMPTVTGSVPPVIGADGKPITLGGEGAASPGDSSLPATPAGPGTVRAGVLAGRGEDLNALGKDLRESATATVTQLQTLREMLDLLAKPDGAQTGGFAELRTKLGNMAAGAGAGKDVADWIANGNLADSAAFQKYAIPLSTAVMRSALGNNSKVAQYEFETFKNNSPTIDSPPEAIERIFNYWKYVASINQLASAEFPKWQNAHPRGTSNEFQDYWIQKLKDTGNLETVARYGTVRGSELKPPGAEKAKTPRKSIGDYWNEFKATEPRRGG